MFKHILVAVDGSACAGNALELAIDLARLEGARLSLRCIVDPSDAVWRVPPSPMAEQLVEAAEAGAQRVIDGALKRAADAGLDAEGFVRYGSVAREIAAQARETGADAIVMGTHGWSGIKHALMGSVAEGVLRHAPCPVIVVRDKAPLEAAAAVQSC